MFHLQSKGCGYIWNLCEFVNLPDGEKNSLSFWSNTFKLSYEKFWQFYWSNHRKEKRTKIKKTTAKWKINTNDKEKNNTKQKSVKEITQIVNWILQNCQCYYCNFIASLYLQSILCVRETKIKTHCEVTKINLTTRKKVTKKKDFEKHR